MDFQALWDPGSAIVVLGGTALATVLRSGRGELRATAHAMAGLFRRHFDYAASRAEIAGDVRDIQHHGLLRASPSHSTDEEIADATDALVRERSIGGALKAHERHKAIRQTSRDKALKTLYQIAELAPIFGLAGTLLSLSQLPADGLERGDLMGAVAMAVLSTLYGLLTAHLLVLPLARKVERLGAHEEQDRDRLMAWLAEQLEAPAPRGISRQGDRAA